MSAFVLPSYHVVMCFFWYWLSLIVLRPE